MRTIIGLLALSAPALAQSTWYVDASGTAPGAGTLGDPFTSLQYAVLQPTTAPGDTLLVASGTYLETLDLAGKDIIIDGSSASPTPILDGGGAGSTVTIRSGESAACVLRGLVLTGGTGTQVGPRTRGGGLWIEGASPTLEDLVIQDNAAFFGGGAAILGGAPAFHNVIFADNLADLGGGLSVDSAAVQLDGGTFRSNRAESLEVQGFGGGALIGTGASVTFDHVRFEQNLAFPSGGGGGLMTSGDSVSTVLESCEFFNNVPGTFSGPGAGGGVLAYGDLLGLRCHFQENGGLGVGTDGASSAGAALGGTYIECTFVGNRAQFGGALRDATASRSTFEGNDASADGSGFGGATYNSSLEDCLLINNLACGGGGGAWGGNLSRCRLLYNLAIPTDTSPPFGGGLAQGSAFDCQFLGNEAKAFGGQLSQGGAASGSVLERCTVVSNSASEGGGTYGCTTRKVTAVGNLALFEGGGLHSGDHRNGIVWHNFPDAIAGNASLEYCSVEGGAPGAGNLDIEPLMMSISGSDVHLQLGSSCIDAGAPGSPPDPDGSPADLGALPLDPAWSPGAASYCRPQRTNGPGVCLPLVQIDGEASLGSPGPVTVRAVNVPPGQFGVLFHGSSPAASPINGTLGVLCVGGSLVRLGVQSSTPGTGLCDGSFSQELSDAYLQSLGLLPGDRLYAQYWFRQATPGATAFSDAADLPILP